jgi:hypothetical protein
MALSYDDQLVVINLTLVLFLEPPSCLCSYYLFACIAFCYQCDVSLHVHVLNIVGLVVLRLNDVCFHIHVNAPGGHFPFVILCKCGV